MNRTALSVIGLAVGAVLIIALFNIYKPQISHLSHDVFDKTSRPLENADIGNHGHIHYIYNGHVYKTQIVDGNSNVKKSDLKLPVNSVLAGNEPDSIHVDHNLDLQVAPAKTEDFVHYRCQPSGQELWQNGSPHWENQFKGDVVGTSPSIVGNNLWSGFKDINGHFTVDPNNSAGVPSGYHIVNGDGIGAKGLTFNHQGGSHEVYVARN